MFATINFFHTDIHTAREMLGVLFESQATIIALVITLTLVAVQLTASEYSPRVIGVFRKDPYMWTLFILYGISMLYDLILLKLVEEGEKEVVDPSAIWSYGPIGSYGPVSISFEWLVSSALLFGTFTFFALIPFILHTVYLLKPENIIERLSKEITPNNILDYINVKEETPKGDGIKHLEDKVQPIMDIIYRALKKYDLETTREGLGRMVEQAINAINLEDEAKMTKHFCNHLQRVGKLAVTEMDAEATIAVIENLEKFAEHAAEKGFEVAAREVIQAYRVVGEAAAKKELEDATEKTIKSLKTVGSSVKKVAFQVILSLEAIGTTAANAGEKLEEMTGLAAQAIGNIGDTEEVTVNNRAKEAVEKIKKIATGKVSENVMNEIKTSLKLLETRTKMHANQPN
jgi:hypothetical protein